MDKLMKYISPFNGRNDSFKAEIIADSVSPDNIRITTMQLRYPRFIHSEFMTHRMFSRNASSSRAIPLRRMTKTVEDDPAFFVTLGKNQAGMQAGADIDPEKALEFYSEWVALSRVACKRAIRWSEELGLHKQIVNRVLEPWSWITVVVTSTEWSNFFALRDHPAAQPEFQYLARLIKDEMSKSTPKVLDVGQWHLPFVPPWERHLFSLEDQQMFSVARSARTSYLTHDRSKPNPDEDLKLAERLLNVRPDPAHASPFEHQATPMEHLQYYGAEPCDWQKGVTHVDRNGVPWSGNFRGWVQHRQLLEI